MPCTFVRLAGCNLRCSYCDTAYAFEGGIELGEDDVLGEVHLMGLNLVEVTGGEPLLQEETLHLIERLLNDGHRVMLETNGSMSIRDVDPRATVIMDIKTPGSGMSEKTDLLNLDILKPADEVKFVLTNRKDYLWTRKFIAEHSLIGRCGVLLSPAFGILRPEMLSKWMLEDRLDARLNIQLHKYFFSDGEK